MVLEIIGSILIFLVPILVGSINFKLSDFVSKFTFGALVIYLVNIIIFYTQIKINPIVIISTLAVIGIVTSLLISINQKRISSTSKDINLIPNQNINNSKFINKDLLHTLAIITFTITLSFYTYTLWRIDNTKQDVLNWDLFHHHLIAKTINSNNFSIFPSSLSDTFNFDAYTTLIHTIWAIPLNIKNINILNFWYYLELAHLIFSSFIVIKIAQSLFNNKLAQYSAVIIHVFTFEAINAYSNLFFIPQNLVAPIGAYLIIKTINKQLNIIETISLTLFCVLGHFLIGGTAVFIAIASFFYQKLNNIMNTKQKFILNILIISVFLIAFISSFYIDLSYVNRGEAAFYTYSLKKKLEFLTMFFGTLLFFIPLGIYKTFKTDKTLFIVLLFIFCGLFFNIPYIFKLYALFRYFLIVAIITSLYYLTNSFNKKMTFAFGALLIAVIQVNTFNNFSLYKQKPFYNFSYTQLSSSERETIDYLNNKYVSNKDSYLLISDPATMHVFETLTGINTPGGAYTAEKNREILISLYTSRDNRENYKKVFEIKDGLAIKPPEKVLFVVSKRFLSWQERPKSEQLSISFNEWTPKYLVPEDIDEYGFIDGFNKSENINLVFSNRDVYVYEVINTNLNAL